MRACKTLLFFCGVLFATESGAQFDCARLTDHFDCAGYVDTYHSFRIKSPNDTISSRTRLCFELRMEKEPVYIFASAKAKKNYKLSDETGVELFEAYIDYVSDSWDMRVGRQIIIWGKADGIQITDIISPPDYTEFITRDLDEIRMAVDALKLRWLGDVANAEVIWIPFFKSAVLPEGDNPWAIKPAFPDDVEVAYNSTKEPENRLKNSEIGAKLSFYLSGIDLALSAFYTWNDYPSLHRTVEEKENATFITFEPEHHRLTVIGMEFSKPLGDFVFRGEAAFYIGKYFEPEDIEDDLFKKKSLNWMLGMDWYPGNNWTIIAQFADNFTLNHDDRIKNDEHAMTATFNVSKRIFRETVTISNMIYFGINNHDMLDRISLDYAMTDEFHIAFGADIFEGSEGMFGAYEDNSQVWIKAKYSF